jgi:hypothetical protein
VTTVQSLYLLNDEFVHKRAEAFAKRLLAETSDDAARLERVFALTLARGPTDREREQTAAWVDSLRAQFEMSGLPAAERNLQIWSALTRVLFRTNEFLYVD